MKRTFSYLLFLVILIAVIAFGYQAATDEESEGETTKTETSEASKAPAEKPKVFASDRLGVSFAYPGSWTAEPVEDSGDVHALFLGTDANCTVNCLGLLLEMHTKQHSAADYDTLLVDFSKDGVIEEGTFQAVRKSEPELSLHIFNKKDTIYVFKTSPSLENSFDQILETFQEIPKVTVTKTPSTDNREFKFESCGNLKNYETQPFYADMVQKAVSLPRYHQPYLIKEKGFTKITQENITDVCYSQVGNLVVMLIKGDYCERGVILKYETDTGSIEFVDLSPSATFEALGRCGSLQGFGKRTGRFISTNAASGDAGGYTKWTLDYDYIDNVLYPKRVCTGTVALKPGEEPAAEGASTTPKPEECKPL